MEEQTLSTIKTEKKIKLSPKVDLNIFLSFFNPIYRISGRNMQHRDFVHKHTNFIHQVYHKKKLPFHQKTSPYANNSLF